MSEGLNVDQRTEAAEIAELAVRRYFDHYLTNVFPASASALISAHNNDPQAHGGVLAQVMRAKFLVTGFAAAGGLGGGVALSKLLSLFQ